jgi:hypothetical protein
VVDPEGDYRSLAALPDVVMLGGDDPPPTARELTRALEHPDASIIIDLSKLTQPEKVAYVRTLMPFLVALRRRTGLPHKILLDEAHYFLADSDHTDLIDPELAGYIVVTYRISLLDPAIRQTGDAVTLVTRETNVDEVAALVGLCRPQPPVDASTSLFGDLQTNEAALLPGAQESHGSIRRFQLAPRLTEHVRHRTKYADMPVADSYAFVFAEDGFAGPRARTLKQFTDLLSELPAERLSGHLRRHDLSRWIGDVFRDRPLAHRIRTLEARVPGDEAREVAGAIAQAIRARYETPADAA